LSKAFYHAAHSGLEGFVVWGDRSVCSREEENEERGRRGKEVCVIK